MFRYNDPAEAAKLRKEGGLGNGNLQSTVANISRLSLLSWSVTDLHVTSSNDNLLNCTEDLTALEQLEIQKAALIKEKEDFKVTSIDLWSWAFDTSIDCLLNVFNFSFVA